MMRLTDTAEDGRGLNQRRGKEEDDMRDGSNAQENRQYAQNLSGLARPKIKVKEMRKGVFCVRV